MSVGFFLVMLSLQLNIKTEKVVGKKFLENRVLSAFLFCHRPLGLADRGAREAVHFTFSLGFLKQLPDHSPQKQAGPPSYDHGVSLWAGRQFVEGQKE